MLAQGKVDETCEFFLAALDAVLMTNRELELLVLKLRRERLGRHTERLDARQIALLFDALLAHAPPPSRLIPAPRRARMPRSIARSPTRNRVAPARRDLDGSRARPTRGGAPRASSATCT